MLALAPFVPAETVGVRLGDRLLQLDGEDLRGVGGLGFYARFLAAAWRQERVPARVERSGQVFETTLATVGWSIFAPLVALAGVFAVFGVAILLKAPRSGVARAVFQAFMAVAFYLGSFSGAGVVAWLHIGVLCASSAFVCPLVLRAILVFPHGVPPSSPWLRFLPVPFAAFGLPYVAMIASFPYSGSYSEAILNATSIGFLGVALTLLHRVYRRVDPVGRRQLKWSVFGIYLACVPPIVGLAWLTLFPDQRAYTGIVLVSLGLAPVFLYIGLYRYDLFDVDRLLSATAAYNLVLVVLAAGWLLVAPRIGDVTSAWLDLPEGAGQGAAALGLAPLVVPAAQRLRPRFEALIFRDQQAVEAGLDRLCDEITEAGDIEAFFRNLGDGLHQCLRPESTVVYGRDGDRYVAVFAAGRGVAAELPGDGPVVATLRNQRDPLCLAGHLTGRRGSAGDAFAAAALGVLNAAIVLPVSDAEAGLAAFVALGPKRSGDLYTESDLHRLRVVADRVALALQREGERQLREESEAMQAAMRRYVPGAVAERIERGDALDAGEQEVTVLFVDVRGYTALAEGSSAREIFSTINRYTRAVSERVREERGAVVEFNGDGMMAVFGAPEALADKERAAVRAARRIAEEVQEIEHKGHRLSVGIGIATGVAFVGNIQAADRMIWSAIGNTTNLAARLQAMTREVDAAVIIDAATHAALGALCDDFRRVEQVTIRGRSDRLDVFTLGAPERRRRAA